MNIEKLSPYQAMNNNLIGQSSNFLIQGLEVSNTEKLIPSWCYMLILTITYIYKSTLTHIK